LDNLSSALFIQRENKKVIALKEKGFEETMCQWLVNTIENECTEFYYITTGIVDLLRIFFIYFSTRYCPNASDNALRDSITTRFRINDFSGLAILTVTYYLIKSLNAKGNRIIASTKQLSVIQ